MPNLSDRIAAVLQGRPSSAEVAAVMAEARQEQRRLDEAVAAARAVMVDPLTSSAEAAEKRRAIDDLALQGERLVEALARLMAAERAALAREADAGLQEAYDAARERRDAVAAELSERYPALAAELVALLRRVAESQAEVERVNRNRPAGAPWLDTVETIVRGVPGNGYLGGGLVPRLADSVRLPALDGREVLHQRPIWPEAPGPHTPPPALCVVRAA